MELSNDLLVPLQRCHKQLEDSLTKAKEVFEGEEEAYIFVTPYLFRCI